MPCLPFVTFSLPLTQLLLRVLVRSRHPGGRALPKPCYPFCLGVVQVGFRHNICSLTASGLAAQAEKVFGNPLGTAYDRVFRRVINCEVWHLLSTSCIPSAFKPFT